MQDFEGKVAVVTGGASGIGLGMARAFAGAGMRLVIADLDESALDAAVSELAARGTEVVGQRCDVSSHEQVQALADVHYSPDDIAAAISSGSFRTAGMVVAPCSMNMWLMAFNIFLHLFY